ncbi:MAG: hypothetical protein M5U12_32905 [Verrucomicrobia bacterium]|nr:hypothetical protein [Verrucomicrobiota bacterium]
MRAETFSTTDLNQLQRQLATWRRRQSGRAPLPEGLWRAAAQLARGQGASTVARTLHLDYYKLRERVAASAPAVGVAPEGPAQAPGAPRRPEFVEVKVATFPEVRAGESVVELCDGGAARMTLCLGGDTAALVALAQSFWRRPR